MLVDHYRRDLMDKLVGHRVIIITAQDVDSVCTVRILTSLFKTEGIQYILLSCSGITDMKAKYADYSSQSDKFLMINCGATFDLLETLENPPKEKTFFVLDYHRPIHVINYYNSTGQVHIISVPEPEEVIPEFDQIFREVPEDDDEEEEVDEENSEERRQRRADYNEWAERRQKILFDYREYSYYARPSALYALEVVWVMSRDDMESIWCTIVSLTDSLIMRRLPRAKYTEFASTVNDHILRISNAQTLPRDCLKVRFGRELFFICIATGPSTKARWEPPTSSAR
ncbi:Cell division control protein 45 [Orchesella cincta]|uniref:Cell division control protein 45 n=1 Tax=Orchesella cincta TaxID=48709 RepID=A0A1D2M0X4_ORCCI|nr:Cell division control protein 45 [Orchesella cincta]